MIGCPFGENVLYISVPKRPSCYLVVSFSTTIQLSCYLLFTVKEHRLLNYPDGYESEIDLTPFMEHSLQVAQNVVEINISHDNQHIHWGELMSMALFQQRKSANESKFSGKKNIYLCHEYSLDIFQQIFAACDTQIPVHFFLSFL